MGHRYNFPGVIPLAARYPKATRLSIDLTQAFLQFYPHKRPTANEALSHPSHSDLHDLSDEPEAPSPFQWRSLEFEWSKRALQNRLYIECLGFKEAALLKGTSKL